MTSSETPTLPGKEVDLTLALLFKCGWWEETDRLCFSWHLTHRTSAHTILRTYPVPVVGLPFRAESCQIVWYVWNWVHISNDISSHQDGGYILFRFRAEGPENVVGMTRSGLLSVIIIAVSHHFKCHIHFFSFSSAFCKGRPPQKKCGFFQTFHPPTPVLEIKESGDLVSCPTRWSLWYWYLNFYVDHISKSKWQRNIVHQYWTWAVRAH